MRTIRVIGRGAATAPADGVELTFTVCRICENTENAVAETDKRAAQLRAGLVAVGFSGEDLKTANFTVSAEYENELFNGAYSRKFKGYACREGFKLAFPYESKRLAEAVSALTAGGAEEEFAVTFTVQDQDALKSEAVKNAFAEAKRRAEALAEASGERLGNIAEMSCNAKGNLREGTHVAETAAMALRSMPHIEPEDIRGTAEVEVVWELA